MKDTFDLGDLERVAKATYGLMEAEAAQAGIQPWPRWNRSQIVTEAVQRVAFSPAESHIRGTPLASSATLK